MFSKGKFDEQYVKKIDSFFSCPSLFFPFSSLVLGLGFLFWVWGFSISLLSSTTGDQVGSKSLKIYRHLRPTVFPRRFPCFPFRSFVSTLSLLGLRRSYPYRCVSLEMVESFNNRYYINAEPFHRQYRQSNAHSTCHSP